MSLSYKQKNKLRLYLVFFLSTLKVSIPVSIVLSMLPLAFHLQIHSIAYLLYKPLLYFPTLGLGAALLYKHHIRKNEYIFYHNMGISRLELWMSSFCLSVLASFCIHQIIKLCVQS